MLWDALVAKYDATDAGNELYLMESFHDYMMVNNRSVVEQAHEVQCIVKDLDLLKCPIPDKFVAGCIIVDFSVEELRHNSETQETGDIS